MCCYFRQHSSTPISVTSQLNDPFYGYFLIYWIWNGSNICSTPVIGFHKAQYKAEAYIKLLYFKTLSYISLLNLLNLKSAQKLHLFNYSLIQKQLFLAHHVFARHCNSWWGCIKDNIPDLKQLYYNETNMRIDKIILCDNCWKEGMHKLQWMPWERSVKCELKTFGKSSQRRK